MLKLPSIEKSFWREAYDEQSSFFPSLDRDLTVDTVIVGAGITGLTTAYLLKKAGQKVAVLEKDTIASGTTGRTTGKVTSQHNLIYADMTQRLGLKNAQVYATANQTAVEMVDRIISENHLACDWQRDDNYTFTTDTARVPELQREAEAAAILGLPASFVTETPLPFAVQGAVKFTGQGKIHAQKYALELARLINGDGSFVFEHSRALAFRDGKRASVKTAKATVTAQDIVVATKIPSVPLLARAGYALFEHPTESYALACSLDHSLPGMYISVDQNHHSILPHHIDGRDILLIVGAGGNIPGFRLSKDRRYRRLARYAETYFSPIVISHKWSDMDYLPHDHFPLVGRVYPHSKHLFTATGYMKWGLSNGTAAAIMLRDIITDQPNEWNSAFESMRLRPILNIPRAIIEHITS